MNDALPEPLVVTARRLVEVLRGEAIKFVTVDKLPDILWQGLMFQTVVDPANGLAGHEGTWRNARGERVGKMIFNSDGSFYAEYDLCVPHPYKRGWFIESVTVWGRGEEIKAEPRVLAMV